MHLPSFLRQRLSALRRRAPVRLPDLSLSSSLPWLDSSSGFPQFVERAEPAVSIVVPAYGQLPMTLRCLRAIARAATSFTFEVILSDDGSEPALGDALGATPGLRVVRSPERQGFVAAANRGAEAARGDSLVFLNNDTAVCDGWLDALQGRLRRPGVGMAGAQLVSPDGLVQEAGGIVWRDGSATNYGRGLHPEAPAVGFVREVDYCSGACLIVERVLFRELGGFDSSYAPGYYEDVDLAFRVQQRGLRVEYEPRARVYHLEGGTAGTDPNVGMKRRQERNRELFVERWSRRLTEQPTRDVGLDIGRQHGVLGQCLVVDRHLPTPTRDGGSKRLVGVLGELRNLGWHVTFAAYDLTDDRVQRPALEAMGVEVLRMPHVTSLESFLAHRGASLDCVVLSRLGVARRLLAPVRRHCPKARVIFDTVDVRSVRESREADLLGDSKVVRRAERTRRQELAMLREADATLVTSPVERDYLRRQDRGAMVAVVPTCYRIVKPVVEFDPRAGALFVGGFRHGPNRDAILWFLDEVWPRIKLLVPSLQLHVVGEEPPLELTRQASSSVHIHGYVPELSALFERVRLSIAPLRFGAGLKGKVHQSLARGLPCVATPVAAEGLGLMPDLHAVLAQSANDFAEGVVRLNSDRDLWQRLSIEGQAHVERYFSARVLRSGLHSALSAPRR